MLATLDVPGSTRMDRPAYTAAYIRFVRVPDHAEAYRAAYLDQSASSRNELQRLHREFVTLPRGHSCTCRCPWESAGRYPPCVECRRLRAVRAEEQIAEEMGRSSVPDSTVPLVLLLDLQRALHVLGENASAASVARWLSEGES